MKNKLRDMILARYDRALDDFNTAMRQLRDAALLSSADCDAVIDALNEKLPGESSELGHRLLRCRD